MLSPTYNYWNRYDAVYEVQKSLNLGGKLPFDQLDGVYGWRTENAVKEFQRVYGLTIDGKWGRQCWSIYQQGYC